MIVLTPTTVAALALHAAEGSWVMFVQVVPPTGYGPIKIEGLRGSQLANRMHALSRDNAYEAHLIGLMPSSLPADDVASFAADYAASHTHDGWFEYSPELFNMVQHVGQEALQLLLGETHPGSFDQDQLVDIEEMAQIIDVSVPTVRRMINAKEIPFLRAGKGYRFVPREVIASLQRRR